jgi:guanylate kinase
LQNQKQTIRAVAPGDRPGAIIVVSAPSGAGKTTILDFLRQQVDGLVYSISTTTRPPRPHEVDGVHYFFVNVDEFKQKIEQNCFAEWQLVHGNYYGTPRAFIDQTISSGLHIIMDIDVYGKKKFDTVYPSAVGILILPPSMEILEKRLRARATDPDDVIRVRLANAAAEIEFAEKHGKYEYSVINDDLAKAQATMLSIIHSILRR